MGLSIGLLVTSEDLLNEMMLFQGNTGAGARDRGVTLVHKWIKGNNKSRPLPEILVTPVSY